MIDNLVKRGYKYIVDAVPGLNDLQELLQNQWIMTMIKSIEQKNKWYDWQWIKTMNMVSNNNAIMGGTMQKNGGHGKLDYSCDNMKIWNGLT